MPNYYDYLNYLNAKSSITPSRDMYTKITPSTKRKKEDEEEDEDTWFKGGAFDDDSGNIVTDTLSTAFGTIADVGLNLLEGAGNMVEGIVDLGAYGVSGISSILGADEFADKTKNFAIRDISAEIFDPMEEYVDPYSVMGNKADNVAQGLGQVAAILLSGGAGAAAGLGNAGVTALTTVETFLSSMGSGMGEAYKSGASDKEAVLYGSIAGAGEAATELIFGGLGKASKALGFGKGLSSADDMLAQKISSKFTSQIAKNFVQYGIKAGGEGTEEVLSGIISALGKKVSYMSEKDLDEIIKDEKLLDQFIAGAVTSGVAQSGIVPGMKSGSLIEANQSNRDFITGYTANEQRVIDKEVENRIAEAEADGTKLGRKEKNAVIEQVQKDLKRGYVSIDTIESALGGDTYNSYRELIDKESKLQEEIESLENMPNAQITVKQSERLETARKELEELQQKSEKTQLKEQLGKEVSDMVLKDMYLQESYNEKGRRSQKYETDISKYTEGQRTTIQNAIDSGVLNNTNKTHEFVDMVAKISADKGVSFNFTDSQKLKETGFAIDGKTVNGYVQGDNVTLNVNSAKALNKVVGHEITHVLEGTELYSELQSMIKQYAELKGEYQTRYDELLKLYGDIENVNIENELTADLVGDYLFSDEDFVNNLSTEKPNIFKRIYEEIKYLVKMVTPGSKEAKQLEKVKRVFDEAYKMNMKSQADNDTNYSLVGIDEDGIETYETSEAVKKLSYSERNKLLLKSVLEDYKGRTAKFTKNGETYYALYDEPGVRKGVYGDKKSDVNGRKAKTNIGADGNYIELAENALYMGTSSEQGKVTNSGFHSDAKIWDYYEKTIKSDGKYYDVLVNVKDTGNAQYVYDITLKETSLPHRTNLYSRGKLVSSSIIASEKKNASDNMKYSISGENASTADKNALSMAQGMELDGVDYEKIRLDTGWYRGYDGKWRFEISDDEMTLLDTSGKHTTLGQLIKHDKLFEAYPYLKDIDVVFEDLEPGVNASFHIGMGEISINNNIKNDEAALKSSLIHEIQHVIQQIEDFSGGSNERYWDRKIREGYDSRTSEAKRKEAELYKKYLDIKKDDGRFVEEMENLERMTPNIPRGTVDWETLEQIEDDPIEWQKFDAERDRLSDKYGEDKVFEFMDLQYELSDIKERDKRSARDLYYDTAGEIEARDVSYRIKMNDEERKQHPPRSRIENVQKDNVVFPLYSISEKTLPQKTANGYNVYGSDIIFEQTMADAAQASKLSDDLPIRDDIAIPQEKSDIQDDLPLVREESELENVDLFEDVEMIPESETLAISQEKNVGKKKVFNKEHESKIQNLKESIRERQCSIEELAEQFDTKIQDYYDEYDMLQDKTTKKAEAFLSKADNLKLRKADIISKIEQRIAKDKEQIKKLERELATSYDADSDTLMEVSDDLPIRDDLKPNPDNFDRPIKTVQDRVDSQVENYKVELESKKRRKENSYRQYNRDIAEKMKYLKMEETQNSENAHNLMSQIEELKTERDNIQNQLDKEISDIRERIKKMSTPEYKMTQVRKQKMQERQNEISELMGDTTNWKDKKSGMGYKLHTLKRNLRDVIGDKEKADNIYRELQGKYNHNEAQLNKESRQIKKAYADMHINKYEDQYIQMLGEYRHNPETTLTSDKLNEFYKKYQNKIDAKKVDKAIDMARDTYDDLFDRVNEVLRENGMREIPYREGYFPHFTEEPQGLIAKLLNWKKEDNSIPTDIAGLTEHFKPNKSYQSFSRKRTGDVTDYSFLKGLDAYTFGALDWIYHIDDIQRFRAFENEIRYRHSDERVKAQIKEIESNESYDAEETQAQIDAVYAEKNNPLNQLVQNIRTHTNLLAGKKNTMDRAIEEDFNRNVYSIVKNGSSRINANMVGGSISSALTNFIPITQSWSQVSPISSLRAMKDTIKSTMLDDGTIDKSDFLTNRLRADEKLSKTTWDKVSDKISFMMEAIDSFTSQTVWRSKYLENISAGMSEQDAIQNADEFAEGVMAGRSRGNMPVVFESKNPITKIFTAFQLEAANQYDYMFKDMPQDIKNKTIGKLAKAYGKMFLGAYVYNALYSSLTGRDAAFDPIGIIEELIADLFDDDDEPVDAVWDFAKNVGGELPYIGGLMFGGGRIPVSSALPYGEGLVETIDGTITDIKNGDYESLTREWLNPVYYLALPAGGGQLKKTMEGLAMFDDDLPIAGSYTDSGNLRFAVEDTVGNRVQAALFGQWANENAQDYIDNERQTLKSKQIEEFAKLNELGMTQREYWDYREGLKEQNTIEEKFEYIANLDATVEEKNIMINNIVERKEDVDLSDYNDYSDYEEFDFATKNPEKYVISKAIGGYEEYSQYTTALDEIKSDKDEDGDAISGSRKEKVIEYINDLDADYGVKIILYKSEYPSDDTYNEDIVEYLNNRDDISYSEMETILKELGFTVEDDGTVRW